MSTENLTLEEALKLVKEYSCIEIKTAESEEEKEKLRSSLRMIIKLSDSENLGICAENIKEGWEALSNYLKAFGYKFNTAEQPINDNLDPVYIKYNTQKKAYYLDAYNGVYRGVLISCQSDNDMISGTYGHFPLDLF